MLFNCLLESARIDDNIVIRQKNCAYIKARFSALYLLNKENINSRETYDEDEAPRNVFFFNVVEETRLSLSNWCIRQCVLLCSSSN